MDKAVYIRHRERGGAREEHSQDEHAPPVGRNDRNLRRYWSADTLLQPTYTASRARGQDRRK